MALALAIALMAISFALVGVAKVEAAIGDLTPQGCISDVGDPAGCILAGQGLDGAGGVAVSPDGGSVYVAAGGDDAIVHFDRDPITGALTHEGCIADVGDTAGCGTTQAGLDGARAVAISGDGSSVYVVALADDAIVRFDRDALTGELTPVACVADVGDTAGCGTTQAGLDGARAVDVSPDGRSVYVAAAGDSAIVRFDRDAAGALAGAGCISDEGDPGLCGVTEPGLEIAAGVVVSEDAKSVYVSADEGVVRFDRDPGTGALLGQGCIADVGDAAAGCGPSEQGLFGATGVAVGPDDESLYVAAAGEDTIVRFGRDPAAGALVDGYGCIADEGDSAGCGATQQGLDGAQDAAVSPDGASVYVPSIFDDAIVRFDRDPATGALVGQGCIADVGDTAGCGASAQGLDLAQDIAISADSESVYVVSGSDDSIVHFDRTTSDPEPPPEPPPPTDPIRCAGRVATIVGTGAAERLLGGPGPDVIAALGGNDTVLGRGGGDWICGGPGGDRIFGQHGSDWISGDGGNDRIWGQNGSDRLFGRRGADRIWGQRGPDRIFGQNGPDRLFGGLMRDRLFGGRHADLLVGGAGLDLLRGGRGRDRTRQ